MAPLTWVCSAQVTGTVTDFATSTIEQIGLLLTQNCTTTSFAYATTSSSTFSYVGPNFQEWLFVMGVGLFMLSFLVWPVIFRFMPTIKKW